MSSLKDKAPENFAQLLLKIPPPIQIYGRDKLPRDIVSHSISKLLSVIFITA